MSRLPGPFRPFPAMTSEERRQYVDCRVWHSRQLEVCFVCETPFDLQPFDGALLCTPCRLRLEDTPPPFGEG